MTPRCLAYRALFRFKQTRLAGWLFFVGRRPFRVVQRNVTVRGVVRQRPEGETDGDRTFDLQACPADAVRFAPVLHCEVTPCDQVTLALVVPGAELEVDGDYCIDPPHFGTPEHHEMHPVRAVRACSTTGA